MRYIKVLLLVILFFLVMMFFVQNQSAFSQAVALKLDLLFLPPVESAPLPFYTLLIICFVLGALCILAMLMWDRVSPPPVSVALPLFRPPRPILRPEPYA